MIRLLAGLLALALGGLPILAGPSAPVVALGAAAAALGVAGALRLSLRLLTAGAVVSLLQYALALWLSEPAPGFATAIALGVVLSLALDVVDFGTRFRGAGLEAEVVRRQVRHWIGSAAVAGGAGILLAAIASRVAFAGPPWTHPAAAALGALLALLGALGALASIGGAAGRDRDDEAG
jgi:hypothetical protein